jgi:hypothetical protein
MSAQCPQGKAMPFFDNYETDLLKSLIEAKVTFAVFGGAAIALHGIERERGDLDLLIEDTAENKRRSLDGICRPWRLREERAADFIKPGGMWRQLPQDDFRGFDLASKIAGIDNAACLASVEWMKVDNLSVPVASVASLIANKEALGVQAQGKDDADLEALRSLVA